MTLAKTGVRYLAAGLVAAVALTACTGKGGKAGSPRSGSQDAHAGGTLYLNDFLNFPHLDPQRTYTGPSIAFSTRTIVRTLTTFPAIQGAGAVDIVADAATDTGTRSPDAKTWTFTLKPNVKWQDGRPVTCADFKYGISRTFAQDVITRGPVYALDYLDIPRDKDGNAAYNGPYKAQGQAGYDKAVQCPAPNKIVFHLRHSVADFNETVTLPAFAAVRKDKDTGAKYDFTPFSDGPYMVQGKWDENRGGTLVRNPSWDRSTDDVRNAYPDKIVTSFGDTEETVYQKLESDAGAQRDAVTMTGAPAAAVAAILGNPAVKQRSANADNGFVDYLSVNVAKVPNTQVRQAIAMSVSRSAYVTAMGGPSVGSPTNSLISPLLKAYTKYDPFGVGSDGNPAKAKAVLQAAGIKLPYPITYAYQKGNTQDKAATNIKAELESAGFKVTLEGLGNNYYDVIANPSQAPEVSWSGWAADWPSGSTVIPPLADGRANISADNLGNDFSAYNDPTTNAAIDTANKLTDSAAQQQAWSALDQSIVKQAVMVPLMADKWLYLHGSNVQNFIMNGAFGGYVDLAVVAVR